MKRCVIIADDLTGACDTALQFRRRGARALVHLDSNCLRSEQSDVDAFSTESRSLQPIESAGRIRELARKLKAVYGDVHVLFKKIDSLLRGMPGAEIKAAMDAFACDVAVITPAFPEMGRTVVNGRLLVEGVASWSAMDVLHLMRTQGLDECQHVSSLAVAKLLANGCRYISVDSASNDELRVLVNETVSCGRKVLWAGSAGLACSLAEILFSGVEQRYEARPGTRPVLFLIGSQHPVTATQLQKLIEERSICELQTDSTTPAKIAAVLAAGTNAVVRVPMGETTAERMRQLLARTSTLIDAVVISGGDTLSLITQAMESDSIEIQGQIVTGLPFGRIRGGLLDGLTIATKSGAFGEPDAFTKVMDFFTCSSD